MLACWRRRSSRTGCAGSPMSAMNLAGVLPWTYGRGFAVVAPPRWPATSSAWPAPFMLPRELGKRLGLAYPQLAARLALEVAGRASLLAAFFWAYERVLPLGQRVRHAGILVGYFAAGVPRGHASSAGPASANTSVPIGQFQFVGSLVSPLERDACGSRTCARAAATHDCHARGNAAQRAAASTGLYLPRKVGNMNCTLCLDCVKACPHDNVGITDRSARPRPRP